MSNSQSTVPVLLRPDTNGKATDSDTSAAETGTQENPPEERGARGKTAAHLHVAVDKVADTAEHALRKAGPAVDRAAVKAHLAVDHMADNAAHSGEWLAAHGADLNRGSKRAIDQVRSFVSSHPLTAIGIAAFVGLILGRLL
jgi:ElaB/YqjD/DUF883 family membrane-anchored ribosome-binding protein